MIKKLIVTVKLLLLFNFCYGGEPNINLHLPKYHEDDLEVGVAMLIAGSVITGLVVAESNKNYTSSLQRYPGTNTYHRVTEPFMQQTPRQLFILSGITITISGLYICLDELNIRKKH